MNAAAAATLSNNARRALHKSITSSPLVARPSFPAAISSASSISSLITSSSSCEVRMNHQLASSPPITSSSSSSVLQQQSSPLLSSSSSLLLFQQQQQQQRRSIFIQTAETPNPESLKFIPNGRLVLGHNSDNSNVDVDTVNPDDESNNGEGIEINNNNNDNHDTKGVYLTRKDHTLIARSPLAKSLFNLDLGIKSIYLGYDFITVTKYAEAHWSHLQTPIFGCIMDFYSTNEPVMRDAPEITDTTILDDDDEVVAMIKELLESRIRPAVQEDGGDIKYVGFEESTGIVTVQLAGSCVGCPSSSVTLKNGVENMLMHYIPEVTNVVALEEEDEEDEGGEGDYVGEGEVKVKVEQSTSEEKKKMKTYQDKLAAAGIPFSD